MGNAIKGNSAACSTHREMVCREGTENHPHGGKKTAHGDSLAVKQRYSSCTSQSHYIYIPPALQRVKLLLWITQWSFPIWQRHQTHLPSAPRPVGRRTPACTAL